MQVHPVIHSGLGDDHLAYGLGRVVYLQPGHHAPSLRPPDYRRLVLNGALWAAGR